MDIPFEMCGPVWHAQQVQSISELQTSENISRNELPGLLTVAVVCESYQGHENGTDLEESKLGTGRKENQVLMNSTGILGQAVSEVNYTS